MSRSSTPSFVCEIPLRVTQAQARVLGTCFEVARQFYNALLGEALRRLGLLRQSTAYQAARRDIPRTRPTERAHAFLMARQAVGFTEGALSQYATRIHHTWIGDHVDAVIGQTLTQRAFQAGLRWRENALHWGRLVLPMAKGAARDPVIA